MSPHGSHPPAREGWLTSLQSMALTVIIALFVVTFLAQAFQIPSESMENTLLIGDYLLVDKLQFSESGSWGKVLPYAEVDRGDIIVFRYPVNPEQHFVKRVVGIPGDRVRLINKRVRVNGVFPREKYALYNRRDYDAYRDEFPVRGLASPNVESAWWSQMRDLIQGGELVVPPGQYFVLGDNRDRSLDSRYWGFVPRENIIGRPLIIYWSVASPATRPAPAPPRDGGKLINLARSAARFFANIRWGRFLQLVS
ncbi:MAG TPA: signal peptidase I [Terriglobales bacterium]|nr:signal peptidase I [Terriglobales bacterium]